jgi:hypothetical protein
VNNIQLTANSAFTPEVGIASEVLLGVLLLALVYYVKVKLLRNTKDFVIANRKMGLGFGVTGLISMKPNLSRAPLKAKSSFHSGPQIFVRSSTPIRNANRFTSIAVAAVIRSPSNEPGSRKHRGGYRCAATKNQRYTGE